MSKIIDTIKSFVTWALDNRKPILTYATFIAVLQAFVKTSIIKQELQDFGPNTIFLLALILGIDMGHAAITQYQNNKSGVTNGQTKTP